VLVTTVAAFATFIFGVIQFGWGFEQMAGVFLGLGLVAGVIGGLGIEGTCAAFVEGFGSMSYAVLMIGVARGVFVVLDQGHIVDTIINFLVMPLAKLPVTLFAMGITIVQSILTLPVPSSSGRVTLTMPILVPLSDLLGLSRQVTVTAVAFGPACIGNFLPTDGALMAILALAGVPFSRWLRFCIPAVRHPLRARPGRGGARRHAQSAVAAAAAKRHSALMDLINRVVIITGGKRIGRVVAQQLADRGADLVLSYRGSKSEAEATVADVQARPPGHCRGGRRVEGADCAALVAAADTAFGRVDALVNMASVYGSKPFDELTEADFDRDLAINLKSAFLCSQSAIPVMKRSGGGRIVNFADWLARSGRPSYHGFTSYYVAKAAIIALTEALALELASHQILVNAIAPGPILAPPDMDPAEVAAVAKATPVGRWGGELEIAKAVIALIETDFITGETLRVDGGRHVA
jgi:NAD(P)-dependent dehydrogenase (short-subunit alcohol dehydrogenase family)